MSAFTSNGRRSSQLTFGELPVLSALGTSPYRSIRISEIISSFVCIIAYSLHALRQSVVVLLLGQWVTSSESTILYLIELGPWPHFKTVGLRKGRKGGEISPRCSWALCCGSDVVDESEL